MTNLTVKMDLVAAGIASGSPQKRAEAWYRENAGAISTEAEHIENNGVPGSDLALNHPSPDSGV